MPATQKSPQSKPSPKRLTHAARVLRIRELLDARPFLTIAELQQEFRVSRRTVYNDIDALQAAGVPVFSEEGPAGEARWKLEYSAKKNTLTLAAGQVVPFGLALQALSFLRGTEVHDQLETIMNKLSVGVTPQARQQLDELGRRVAIVPHGPKSYADKVDVLDDILSGLLHCRKVELWYRAAGRPRARRHVVAPLTLVLYREALYLIGESERTGTRLVFAVDRISKSEWLKERFTYPADHSPEQFFDGCFGMVVGAEPVEVELVFAADQAQFVRERNWHPTQRFDTLPDGRTRMLLTVSGESDVLLWLLGHTTKVEVLSPPALRARVREGLAAALARHEGPPPAAADPRKARQR